MVVDLKEGFPSGQCVEMLLIYLFKSLSHIRLFATPLTIQSVEF